MKKCFALCMDKPQFQNEKNYLAARDIVRALMQRGLLTHDEFVQFDTMFCEKFSPVFGILLAENPCNYSENGA